MDVVAVRDGRTSRDGDGGARRRSDPMGTIRMRWNRTKRSADVRGSGRNRLDVDAKADAKRCVRGALVLRGQVGGQALRYVPSAVVERAEDVVELRQRDRRTAPMGGRAVVVCLQKHARRQSRDASHQRIRVQRKRRKSVQKQGADGKEAGEDRHVVPTHVQTVQVRGAVPQRASTGAGGRVLGRGIASELQGARHGRRRRWLGRGLLHGVQRHHRTRPKEGDADRERRGCALDRPDCPPMVRSLGEPTFRCCDGQTVSSSADARERIPLLAC